MNEKFFQNLVERSQSKIVLVILDGLGGLPQVPGGKTELETACKPNLDALAERSSLGLSMPVGPGITAGSGPGHLAIFGYDPIQYEIGRGVLEALGVDFELSPDDVAARGNFCTLDETGIITDRRAGRLPTEENKQLVERLRSSKVEGVEFFVEPIREHRFAFIMRAPGLDVSLSDTDPLKTGTVPLQVKALHPNSQKAAGIVNQFILQSKSLLADQPAANMVMLRGFSKFPTIPHFSEMFKLNAAAVAVYGMYRGVSRLAGMDVLNVNGVTLADEFTALEKHWKEYDFFYLHFKKTDTCGENGDFLGKVKAIEEFDSLLPRLIALQPDVILITGDHSTPAVLKSHSWHPVPLMLYSEFVRADRIAHFGEQTCARGSLGLIPAKLVMQLVLANAGRVAKYGA